MAEIAMDDLLRAAFAPWNERSWDNLAELYPDAARALEAAVDAGLTAEGVRDYCNEQGYPPGVGHWMAQAVQHLARQRQAAADSRAAAEAFSNLARVAAEAAEAFSEPDKPASSARPALAIRDGAPGRAAVRRRVIADARGVRLAQPGRTRE